MIIASLCVLISKDNESTRHSEYDRQRTYIFMMEFIYAYCRKVNKECSEHV